MRASDGLDFDGLTLASIERVSEEFIKMCSVPGETSEVFKLPVLRWKPGLWKNSTVWARVLKRMFEQRTAIVYHLAGFNVTAGEFSADFRRALIKMKNDIQTHGHGKRSLASKHDIRTIALMRRIDYGKQRPSDGVTGGQLHYTRVAPNDVVFMRFPEEKDLKGFLADTDHTLLRMTVFLEFAKTNSKLASVLSKHNIREAKDILRLVGNKRKIYEEIERAAALWRIDFRDDEMIDELVESEPLPFPE